MKKILLLLFFAIVAVGWFHEPIKQWGMEKTLLITNANSNSPSSYSLPKSNFILPDPEPVDTKKPSCITLAEYTQQVNSDPSAYYKLFNCGQSEQERTEADKLINFLTHLKYE